MHQLEQLPDLAADARRVAQTALLEDGDRDLTTQVTFASAGTAVATGVLECRERVVVAGVRYADAVAGLAQATITWKVEEGQAVDRGPLGEIRGSLAAVLRAERPLLNLLQRATGIATLTRRYVDALAGTLCRVLHTRKTTPGLRLFDVAAVVAGGGSVHRLDLAHTVMVKDNHWAALQATGRSLAEALDDARALGVVSCQVEVESEAALREACAAGANRLLIDNQNPSTVQAWGTLARSLRPGITIEATGGVTLENARLFAEAGADFVSVGELTHSVRAANIALEL
ncbi:MAG: carboxylating nicotinate-nucleotide diphosphorylase [Gemmatimonadales bacterium]|nr:carboxylating nicotinate-nucleotide diphosphorylase [Gemmatimonadales bacterium]